MLINAATRAAFDLIAPRGAGPYNLAPKPGFCESESARQRLLSTAKGGRTSYVRDGRFSISRWNVVGSNARPVLGFTSDAGALYGLHVDPVDEALSRCEQPVSPAARYNTIDRRSIHMRCARTANDLRLAMWHWRDFGTRLPSETPPHLGRANDGNFGAIAPMQRENGDASLDRSLDRLHDAYIAFDALQAAHKAQGHVGKTVMDLVK